MKEILIGLLIISGVLFVQAIFNTPDEIIITGKDNDSEVKIALGDILTLKLEACLGTGNTWHVMRNDPDLLELLGEPKVEPIEEDTKKEEPPLVGKSEYLIFRFEAQNSGTNILELHYFRIFEKEKAKPSKTFKITVLIY